MSALGALDIKILKVVPSFVDDRITTEDNEEYLRDSFASLATVQYRLFGSSRIRMGDLDVATSDYFRKVDRFKIVGRFVTCFSTLEAIASHPEYSEISFLPDQTAGNIYGNWVKESARQEPQRRVSLNRQG